MTILAAENVGVKRGGKAILEDVSFQAYAGEFIAVLGANGAGKSTLLKVLAGLMKPSSGKVMLGSKKISAVSLRNLAAHFGIAAEPETQVACENPRYQWENVKNIWHNGAIRNGLVRLAALPRKAGDFIRRPSAERTT